MSFNMELPKEISVAWRKFLGSREGQFGLDWLRRNCRRADGDTDMQMIRNAARWEGYQTAIDDIEDRLTAIKQIQQSLEEAPLETPGGR